MNLSHALVVLALVLVLLFRWSQVLPSVLD
jgi:hypothetical protein